MEKYFRKGAFVPFYEDIFDSAAYEDLSCNARCLLLELARIDNYYANNGDISISQKDAANLLKSRTDTIPRIYDELVVHGFLLERKGGRHKKNRLGQKWIMTMLRCNGQKATDEWKRWRKDSSKNNVVPIRRPTVKGKSKRNQLTPEFRSLASIDNGL